MTDSHSESDDNISQPYQFNTVNHIDMMDGDAILRQALGASNLEPSAQIKVNELLYHWLSLPQTRFLVNDLAHECVLENKDSSSNMILENDLNEEGKSDGLSATHGDMELEVKESEKRTKQYHVDGRSLLEKHSLRKAAVAAASFDSHPPLSPCNSPDPLKQEVTPNSGTRRSKKGLGNRA